MDLVADGVSENGSKPGTDQWWVVCLCARWCGVCNQYQATFAELAQKFPQVRFVWLDVEDHEDVAGDLDIETFPSVLISEGASPRFFGPVLPQAQILARMLDSLYRDAGGKALQAAEVRELLGRIQAAKSLGAVLL
ncbi:thioredoxin family protein [Comamonas composti]|uniref:thioredoxin family protein n=1 Tax=Comamonas composti TaxID=408558 RepID=UPI00047E4718|nr:thioredoxin domain-containing protein [Comamonas composti]